MHSEHTISMPCFQIGCLIEFLLYNDMNEFYLLTPVVDGTGS